MLADAHGTYVLQRVFEGTSTISAAPPTTVPRSNPGDQIDDRQYLGLVEYYRQMRPDDVAAHLARVTSDQARSFTIWEAFGAEIHFAACLGNDAGNIVWRSLSGPVGCAQIIAERRQTIELAAQLGLGDPFSEAETQRLQVINMYKCSLGIHSRELCQSYASSQAVAGQILAGIGQNINDNMGCTEQWEEQGTDPNTRVYLGCW